ncbi:ABC transporter ATP-binding protein [Sulfolobus acidocaldarius SUSAZ]|nr:ABC transporter ATP-binding protein [Sulfolobus acidocaldarius SUSAZ]
MKRELTATNFHAMVNTDLGRDLKLEQETVEITGNKAKVYDSKHNEVLNLNGVVRLNVESGITISKLIGTMTDGKVVELAYFTKRKEEVFKKLAEAFNSGEQIEIKDEVDDKSHKPGVNTLRWLFSISSRYRKTMILGAILSLISTGLNLVPPYLLKILIDNVLISNDHSTQLFQLIVLLLFTSYASLALVSSLQTRILNNLGSRIINDLREILYNHVIKHDYSFIERISPSRILSRLTTDAGNTNWLLVWGLPTLVTNFFTLLGIGVILFTLNPLLATFILIPIPLILFMVVRYRKRSHRLYHRNWRRSADITSRINDTIPNFLVVRSFSKEEYESKRLRNMLDKLYESSVTINRLNSLYWPIIGLVVNLSTVIIWWVGGHEVISGVIELGVITAFIAYLSQFYSPINNLSNVLPFIQQSLTSAERIREVLEVKPQITNSEAPKRPVMPSEIVFENVFFGYDPHFPVVKNLNINIRPGEKVAIVGKSGSGKSTIAKLLLRFYDVNKGKITIGGVDLKEIDIDYLRRKVAYVPQDVVLFDTTVGYNVAYGSDNVNETDIVRACKTAKIHDEIVRLPFAYDTILGERGTYLSGGQRQRLSIARAIIKNPDVLIFDEATSNLDVVSEREVYEAMMEVSRNKTVILITHNIHEVMNADKVIVLENGEVIERGKPRELLRSETYFHKIFKDQINEENVFSKNGNGKEIHDIRILDPRSTMITPAERRSRVTVKAENEIYRDLIPKALFPITNPKFIGFYSDDGKEIFLLEDYSELDNESLKVLENALLYNNLVFKVVKINNINIKGDQLEWDLVTDKGVSKTFTLGRRNVVVFEKKVVLIDRNDNLYEINMESIDRRSLRLLLETI